MEAKAILKFGRLTPRKARRVADLIRGKSAAEAIVSLRFMPYRAAQEMEKLIKSALANAENRNADTDKMVISHVVVDAGPTMKRMEPRAQGRANVIRKRTSHITLTISGE